VKELGGQTTRHTRLPNQRIELAVDADASVTATFERFLGEPVVPIAPAQNINKTVMESAELQL